MFILGKGNYLFKLLTVDIIRARSNSLIIQYHKHVYIIPIIVIRNCIKNPNFPVPYAFECDLIFTTALTTFMESYSVP